MNSSRQNLLKTLNILQRIRHTDPYLRYELKHAQKYHISLQIIYSKSLLQQAIECLLNANRPLMAMLLANIYTGLAQVRIGNLNLKPSYEVSLEAGTEFDALKADSIMDNFMVLSWEIDYDAFELYLMIADKFSSSDQHKSLTTLLFIFSRFQFHAISDHNRYQNMVQRVNKLFDQLNESVLKQKVYALWIKVICAYQEEKTIIVDNN